jgi:ribosomal protein S18 acetylase RimI-like enzyme
VTQQLSAPILTDTSGETLSRVSEEHFFETFTCYAIVPGVEVRVADELIRVVSPGIPNWLTNTVVRCRLSAENADAVIDQTNDYFAARGVTPYWRLCPGDQPSDLAERLIRKGLALSAELPAMAVDLHRLNEAGQLPDGLIIERAADAATLCEHHGWIRSFGAGQSLGSLTMDLLTAYGFSRDSAWQHYLGFLGGKAVSWASVFYATGVAGILGVGTLPEARRRGIASAVTLRALLDARARGYRVAMLQSSALGYNVYRRLGFQTYFTIKTYVRPPTQA